MTITKLELKNFKRFTDLTIDMTALAEPAKLVLLIGTNGSGKSSVFDAFEFLNKEYGRGRIQGSMPDEYYKKEKSNQFKVIVKLSDGKGLASSDVITMPRISINKNAFYGRSSIRQIPKLTKTNLGQIGVSFENDSDRPQSFIDRDNRFENDIEKVASSILTDVFKGDSSTAQIKQNYIDPINNAFDNIFGLEDGIKIKLVSFKPPLEGKVAEILFEKGSSQIPYDYLSSGEKEIFNILLNLLTRKEYFTDTVYFLDEIDLHLNTLLQKNLLKEITENWIPENCQLWTASHSLGFIEYANETESAVIIDFDNLNFDIPQIITPSVKNNLDVFEIAVNKDFLSKVFEGKRIVFSENTDTPLYNNLSIKDTIFFNAHNKADVFYKTKNNPAYNGLVDRDYLTDEEKKDLLNTYKNLYILDYYSIENYLFHPDNLNEYLGGFDTEAYIISIRQAFKSSRDKILLGLTVALDSYPFYRETENDKKRKAMRSDSNEILKMLDSDEFETFYKVFPAKDYGTQIKERQNLSRSALSQTNWFKNKIEELLRK